jgi:lactoylglutathione lyase
MEYLHTMIRVRDLAESLAFYVDLLGFEEVRRMESEEERATFVFLAAPEDAESGRSAKFAPVIELASYWDEDKRGGPGGRAFAHMGYRVDDIYATCADLQAKGVTLNRPPRDGFKAYLKSPEGMTIELIQRRPALEPREPWFSQPDNGIWND